MEDTGTQAKGMEAVALNSVAGIHMILQKLPVGVFFLSVLIGAQLNTQLQPEL